MGAAALFVQRQKDRAVIRQQLFNLLTDVVWALDQERISEESFQSFRVVWQIALDLHRERQARSGESVPHADPTGRDEPAVAVT
jgi:hypothetical protein